MKLREAFLWQPGWAGRSLILLGGALVVTAVGYVHALTGLAYEFHLFFVVPVLVVSWFLGSRFGYAVALLAAVEWFLADRLLAGEAASLLPLLFNTVVRLAILIGSAWLVGSIRNVLVRESRLAREDALTRLPNRREFHDRGRQAFAQAQRQKAPFTAVFIDLDRFKEVNDQHGHGTGDELLRRLGTLLRKSLRETDLAGRIGGDEFVVVMPQTDLDDARRAAARVLRAFHDDPGIATAGGERLPVRASLGVATLGPDVKDAAALVALADEALYDAKGKGRGRVA